jgi:hypothetical protein
VTRWIASTRVESSAYLKDITRRCLFTSWLSDYDAEEEKLRKLYDQARTQGNKKKKREYKDKIAELNRLRKSAERESAKSKN